MKRTIFLVTLFILFLAGRAEARLCIANPGGGDWNDPATWDCGTVPGNNDTMWIPVGVTVVVDINSPEYENMLVIVDGELNFEFGMKINICPGGVYLSATGSLTGGTPGSKINICNSTVWNGPGPTYGPTSYGDVILPVEMLSFTGTLQTSGFVLLDWATATETNNSHFCVERSTNGFTYTEIGRVAGHGTSSQTNNYTFTDASPAQGTNYYRLKQTDYNGVSEYFGIVVVEVLTNGDGCVLTVFPNPCQGMCTVNFADCPNDNSGYITLQLIDANGQVVSEQVPQRKAEGGFSTTIDATNNLKPGVYIVRGISSRKTYTQNVVIK